MKELSTINAEPVEKITREIVRAIEPGKSYTAKLPDFAATQSARNTVTQVSKLDGATYNVSVDSTSNEVTITRND